MQEPAKATVSAELTTLGGEVVKQIREVNLARFFPALGEGMKITPTPGATPISQRTSVLTRTFTHRMPELDQPATLGSGPANDDVGEANETPPKGEISQEEKERREKASRASITPCETPNDESEEEKKARTLNALFNRIFNNFENIPMDADLKKKIFNELWEDFSSNQYYIPTDTTNSTQQSQASFLPTRNPPASEKYTAKLTPPTYYGVGIQTELVREDNKSPYLNITQFYDDSGFESALKVQYKSIETQGKNFKITEIECDFDDNGTKAYYSIDKIFIKCGGNQENFNLKLCDIFRNPNENELKLKFSIEGGLQDQKLTIEKSVFTKGENNEEYKNIKTVIEQQTVTRKPPEAVTNPQNGGRPVDNTQALSTQSVVA